jgi:hypothetical protein
MTLVHLPIVARWDLTVHQLAVGGDLYLVFCQMRQQMVLGEWVSDDLGHTSRLRMMLLTLTS